MLAPEMKTMCNWRWLAAFALLHTTIIRGQDAEANLPPGIIKESYQLRLSNHKDLNLYLRYPEGGKEAVKGVLAFCKFGDRDIQLDLSSGARHFGHLIQFADQYSYAIVAFGQPSRRGWNRTVSTDQLSRRAASEQDRNLDALSREWSRTITRFAKKYSLPDRDWLLYGICGGAQYAHRIALRQPQHFAAVHVHYGGSYDVPTEEGKSIRWLVTSFLDEPAYMGAQRFYQQCREKGYEMILKGFSQKRKPGESQQVDFYGNKSPLQRISIAFFSYAIREGGEPLADPFIADIVNGAILRRSQGSWIPESQTVVLPTRALAEAWGTIDN